MNKFKNYMDIISEGNMNYATQAEAEFMAKVYQVLADLGFSTGMLGKDYKTLVDTLQANYQGLWDKTFGDNSPWILNTSGKKAKVKWDKNKAKALGL